jgi:hypothetical protein
MNKSKIKRYEKETDFSRVTPAAITGIGSAAGCRTNYEQMP